MYRFLDEIIYVEQPHFFKPNSELVCQDCQLFFAIYVDNLLIFGSNDFHFTDVQDKLNT